MCAIVCHHFTSESSPLPYSKMNLSRTCLTLTFIFSRSCTVDVAKEAVALVLELAVPVGEREIVLTEEVFESVTALVRACLYGGEPAR